MAKGWNGANKGTKAKICEWCYKPLTKKPDIGEGKVVKGGWNEKPSYVPVGEPKGQGQKTARGVSENELISKMDDYLIDFKVFHFIGDGPAKGATHLEVCHDCATERMPNTWYGCGCGG